MPSATLQKPTPWSWHPAGIDPTMRTIARDLYLLAPFWDRAGPTTGPANRHAVCTPYGWGRVNPGSSTATGVIGAAGYPGHGPYATPGSAIAERSTANQLELPYITNDNPPTPGASFVFTLADVPAASGASRYQTVFSMGPGLFTTGYTPWMFLVYRRASAPYSHRLSIYNRLNATLYGDGVHEDDLGFSTNRMWLEDEIHTIGVVWDEADDIHWYVDGSHKLTVAASGPWQSSTGSGIKAKFFHAHSPSSTEYDFVGDLYFSAVWDRALGRGEMELMTRNPYALITRPLWTPDLAPSGGTQQDITAALVSQTIAATDPTVTTGQVEITPALMSQLVSSFLPIVSAGETYLTPALESQLVSSLSPIVTAGETYVTPTLESQLTTATDPSVAVGAAPNAIDPALESQLVATYGPNISTLTQTIVPTLINQLVEGFVPFGDWRRIRTQEIGSVWRRNGMMVLGFGYQRSRDTQFEFDATEGWEEVSKEFWFPWDKRHQVMEALRPTWVLFSDLDQAALTAKFNDAIDAAGYPETYGDVVPGGPLGVMT